MSDVEDEEAFLYGSDAEQEGKAHATRKPSATSAIPESLKELADDQDEDVDVEEDEQDGSDYESESEDDIEIIVDSNADTKADGSSAGADSKATSTATATTTTTADGGAAGGKTLPGHQASTIDLDNVPMYKGKKLTELDLAKLESKPWRLPGADLTDYFNYGFNEITWLKYLGKHEQIKQILQQQAAQLPVGVPQQQQNSQQAQPPMPPMGMAPFMPMPPQFNMFNPMMNQGNRPMMWNNPMNKQQQQQPLQQQQQQSFSNTDKSPTPPTNTNLPRIPGAANLPQIPKMTPPPLPPPAAEDDREAKERQLGNTTNNYRDRDDGSKRTYSNRQRGTGRH